MNGQLTAYFEPGAQVDFDWMARTIVQAGERVPSRGRKKELETHLRMLEAEFSGLPFIGFYHAGLNVHIRRKLHFEHAVSSFYDLWQQKADLLLETLNARWLVAACDTIADTSPDMSERALAICGSVLTNVVKLYESERLATRAGADYVEEVNGGVQLFDGLTGFAIGKGDMIRNLFARASRIGNEGSIAARILAELIERAKRNDTVFRRFAKVHWMEQTKW